MVVDDGDPVKGFKTRSFTASCTWDFNFLNILKFNYTLIFNE